VASHRQPSEMTSKTYSIEVVPSMSSSGDSKASSTKKTQSAIPDLTETDIYRIILEHVAADGSVSKTEKAMLMRLGLALSIETIYDDLEKVQDRPPRGPGEEEVVIGDISPAETYSFILSKMWADGIVTEKEQRILVAVRRSLGVSPVEHQELLQKTCGDLPRQCPHCRALIRSMALRCTSCGQVLPRP